MKRLARAVLAAAWSAACAEEAPKFLSSVESASPSAGEGGESEPGSGLGGHEGLGGAPNSEAGGGGAGDLGSAGSAGETSGPGVGGSGGETGAAGDSGNPDQCAARSVDEDCEPEDCFVAACVEGRCDYEPAEAGSACGSEGEQYCDGDGACVECVEDSQCASDAACAVGDCTSDFRCELQFLEAGENCDDGEFCNGDERCDGEGICSGGSDRCAEPTVCDEQQRQCVGCRSSDDCPDATPTCNAQGRCICTSDEDCAVDDECRVGSCDLATGACRVQNREAGTPVGEQTSGDCRSRQCNENGAVVMIALDTDAPADPGDPCTLPACQSGNVISKARPENTPCGAASTECSMADTCDAQGVCLPNHLAQGSVIRSETASDCRRRTCDGNGNAVETPTDAACEDGLFCTGTDTCDSGGTCQHSGDPCTTPALPHCVGSACRQCIIDVECPGLEGPGTGRCSGGTCVECTDATHADDCGGPDTGCSGGQCYVKCDCSEEWCSRSYDDLCQ